MGRHLYQFLSETDKKIYDYILRGLELREVVINAQALNTQKAFEVYFAIYYDRADLFYIPSSLTQHYDTNNRSYLNVNYLYNLSETKRRQKNIDKAIKAIEASSDLSDEYSIVCNASDYIAKNTVYKIDHVQNQNASSALSEGIAQCSGYARALQVVLERFGIECITVVGDSIGADGCGRHAWNIVKINNKYYHLDVTYWDGINGDRTKFIYKDYLFYTDDQMDEDHFWERDKYPKCFDDDLYKLFRSGKSKCPSRPKKIYNNKVTLKNDIVEAVNSRQKKLRFDTTFAGKDTLKVIDSYIRFAGIMTGAAMDWNIIKDKDYIVEIRYKN